jgi:adenylylsulfate kinase-like enzyme
MRFVRICRVNLIGSDLRKWHGRRIGRPNFVGVTMQKSSMQVAWFTGLGDAGKARLCLAISFAISRKACSI